MGNRERQQEDRAVIQQILGYLNFSSGVSDPQFLANVDALYAVLRGSDAADRAEPIWLRVGRALRERLDSLRGNSSAFANADQADCVLRLAVEHVLPAYREYHADLLFHQDDETLFGSFAFGRICEAVLSQGGPWTEIDRITAGAVAQLNDYLGHRPVAVLQTQKIEPYDHEWVRPIPLYVRGAGAASGKYRELVRRALAILEQTDDDILREACFEFDSLAELALDPRAYDFDHPVNKRPNYHFGQWDPHQIDNRGRYHRFVVQQVTLDALLDRIDSNNDMSRDELVEEAAAVLAGTMLMASGVSGWGPDAHGSDTTLHTLLPPIAAYRDAFYERLFPNLHPKHVERLADEVARLRQPLGGARQHLNSRLARRRAAQLERVCLARIFARMGYPEASRRQIDTVPAASARMQCHINCRLSAGRQAVERKQLVPAADSLREIVDLLHRAIGCGAMVDPWNILGFDAHFSLFPALENSVHDHRIDDLVGLMDQVFSLYSRVWIEAAALSDVELARRVSVEFEQTARWWHRFAAHEVSSIESPSATDTFFAAENVAEAMSLWHKGGAAAGDVKFWAPHAELFSTPRAYATVISALLDRGDFIASMALLMHWIGQAENVGLQRGNNSFHKLARRWLYELIHRDPADGEAETHGEHPEIDMADPDRNWTLVRKFLDYLEANADRYWEIPRFEVERDRPGPNGAAAEPDELLDEDSPEEGGQEDLFGAAYDEMVYHDSTDDGVEGEIFDLGQPSHDQLQREAKRIADRLDFLAVLARLWKTAALSQPLQSDRDGGEPEDDRNGPPRVMFRWFEQATRYRRGLLRLLDDVAAYPIPRSNGDHDSMVRYDRQRLIKETLLEHVVTTGVAVAESTRLIFAAVATHRDPAEPLEAMQGADALEEDERWAVNVFRAALRGDTARTQQYMAQLLSEIQNQPILYVPLAKGGDSKAMLAVRIRQRMIHNLLRWLPRLGLLTETRELLETAREMEQLHVVGPGAITEFDDLFEIGYRALVECLVRSARAESPEDEEGKPQRNSGSSRKKKQGGSTESVMVACLEQMTRELLISWLSHARTLRLSVLEKVNNKKAWGELVQFIKRYGENLFTQKFLNLGNLRGVLHQGVDAWIDQLEQSPEGTEQLRFMQDIDKPGHRKNVVRHLTLVLEAVIENFGEYCDYNSTTTQSDRGEMIYTLLDFLRLRNSYDRVAWDMKPIVLAHEILVRRGLNEAARYWRRALAERVSEKADHYLEQLRRLQEKYAMRMPTVADHLRERFVRPLAIDRVRALVAPAMREAAGPAASESFELLEEETALLTEQPSGAGLHVPAWLVALEDEVERARRPAYEQDEDAYLDEILPPLTLSLSRVQQQLSRWHQRTEGLGLQG